MADPAPETPLDAALRLARCNLHGPAGTRVLADEIDRLRAREQGTIRILVEMDASLDEDEYRQRAESDALATTHPQLADALSEVERVALRERSLRWRLMALLRRYNIDFWLSC